MKYASYVSCSFFFFSLGLARVAPCQQPSSAGVSSKDTQTPPTQSANADQADVAVQDAPEAESGNQTAASSEAVVEDPALNLDGEAEQLIEPELEKEESSELVQEESSEVAKEESMAGASAADSAPIDPGVSAPPAAEPPATFSGPRPLFGADGQKIHVGGFGGLSAGGTWMNDQTGALLGVEGGVILDHRLVLGLSAYGLASEINGPRFENGNESLFAFGYGGLTMRYQIVGEGPIYGSVGTLIGGGALTLIEKLDETDWDWDDENAEGDLFFVVEPSVQLHANFTRWMRMGISAGYRVVSGVNNYGLTEADLRGLSFGANLQFGWF